VAAIDDVVAMRAALVEALCSLPRRQREALALRYLADLPEAEVAAALGVSAGSVKTHLHRGIAQLRATFDVADDAELEARLAV
jgi:RNA polymerase sigma factor (sigma-70 family)